MNTSEEGIGKRLTDNGVFNYTETGFTILVNGENCAIEWDSIKAIFGYKLDLMTIDEICIDIFTVNEISFHITEETPGWYVFIEKIVLKFPTIDKGWYQKVMYPPFATKLILLYEKEGLTLKEAENIYYPKNKWSVWVFLKNLINKK